MRLVHGGIIVCDECISKILSLYIACNPFKTLCPFCNNNNDNKNQCDYCAIKELKQNKKEHGNG